MESQQVGRSTACHSLDHLCVYLPSLRGACPSAEGPCHAFNLISAASPLLRGEVLLNVKESYHTIPEKRKRNQSLVDELSSIPTEYSSNLSNCRKTPCPSLPQVCTHCQPCDCQSQRPAALGCKSHE